MGNSGEFWGAPTVTPSRKALRSQAAMGFGAVSPCPLCFLSSDVLLSPRPRAPGAGPLLVFLTPLQCPSSLFVTATVAKYPNTQV